MIGDLVSRLIAAGTPPEVAAVVVTEAFAAGFSSAGNPVESRLEKIRAADRDRKRNKINSSGIPAESIGILETPLTLSSLQQEENSKKEGKKVRARKIPIPAEWQPSEVHFEAAAKLGVSREAVLNKAEDMRIWAGSNGSLKKDWDLTFHGFLRRDAQKYSSQSNGKSHAAAAPTRLSEAISKLRQHVGEAERGEEGRGPPPRLLSHG